MPQQTFLNGSALSTVRERLNANAEDAEERLSELVSRVGVVESAVDAIEAAVDAVESEVDGKQDALVSGTSIKTVNGNSLLGSGNLVVSGGGREFFPTIANNASDSNNDIDVGSCRVWVTNGTDELLVSYAGGTKRLDAAWSVGTNQGGLDSGTKANSTWYYLWLIHRSDTSVTDLLLSTSPTSPTMPSGYTFRRLLLSGCAGAVVTNGSGNIRNGLFLSKSFVYNDLITDLSTTSPPTSSTSLTVTIPQIANVRWDGNFIGQIIGSNEQYAILRSGASTQSYIVGSFQDGLERVGSQVKLYLPTNVIFYNASQATNWSVFSLRTVGWGVQ